MWNFVCNCHVQCSKFTSVGPFTAVGPFTFMEPFCCMWPFYTYIGPFTTIRGPFTRVPPSVRGFAGGLRLLSLSHSLPSHVNWHIHVFHFHVLLAQLTHFMAVVSDTYQNQALWLSQSLNTESFQDRRNSDHGWEEEEVSGEPTTTVIRHQPHI